MCLFLGFLGCGLRFFVEFLRLGWQCLFCANALAAVAFLYFIGTAATEMLAKGD